jgi:acetyl-CoA acetyltransferase
MPHVAAITYLPCRGAPRARLVGDGEAITIAEVHEFFAGIELISYEGLGFAERFGGNKLVEAKATTIGGGCR